MTVLINNLSLRVQIFRRTLRILPKRKKKIKLLYFNHVPDADSSDTLIIRYRFTNAVYYDIDGKKTFDARYVLVRPDTKKDLKLTVHGFMRKANYTVTVEPNSVYITKVL